MSVLPPEFPGLMRHRVAERSRQRDVVFVAVVVAVSVVSSVIFTIMLAPPEPQAFIPAVIIPLCVSLPVSLYLVRLRRRIEALNRKLIQLARHDQLTGLLNRAAFAADVAATGEGGALILIDVDQFKAINDQLGHLAGDFAIRELARQIAGALPAGAMAGRLGGDEFCVFLPGLGLDAGLAAADALRINIAEVEFSHEGRIIDLTISAGVSSLMAEDTLDLAVRSADRALYHAKDAGRNLVRRGQGEE